MMLLVPARLTIGTPAAPITSSRASEFGALDGPMMASTRSSSISLRAARTAAVVSDASSNTTQRTGWPPTVRGSRSMVLRAGMPRPADGPVRDSTAPSVTSARTGMAPSTQASMRASAGCRMGAS